MANSKQKLEFFTSAKDMKNSLGSSDVVKGIDGIRIYLEQIDLMRTIQGDDKKVKNTWKILRYPD
jgi:hypothetical protein